MAPSKMSAIIVRVLPPGPGQGVVELPHIFDKFRWQEGVP